MQNFLSAATGIVVVIALIRGFARHSAASVGNAWVDLTRVTLWVLLPISFVLALFLVQQGSVQNLDGHKTVQTLESVAYQAPRLGPDGQPLKNDQHHGSDCQPPMSRLSASRKNVLTLHS